MELGTYNYFEELLRLAYLYITITSIFPVTNKNKENKLEKREIEGHNNNKKPTRT